MASGSKISSRSSRASSAATKAKARAEAAMVEAKFAAKEAEVMKEKARIEARKAELEANLYVLKTEKCATAASAEAAVYEAAVAMEDLLLIDLAQIPPEDTAQRTEDYVEAHYVSPNAQQEAPVSQQQLITSSPAQRASSPPQRPVQWYPLLNRETNLPKTVNKNEVMFNSEDRDLSYPPPAESHASGLREYACEAAQMTDFAKHLVRREIVSSGLLKFDDCPENYWAWKTSFQDVTRELGLTAREELD